MKVKAILKAPYVLAVIAYILIAIEDTYNCLSAENVVIVSVGPPEILNNLLQPIIKEVSPSIVLES